MSVTQDDGLFEVLLDSWDRNNTILVNLLRVLLPLPLRSSFLIGACLFTNERVA